MRRIAHGLFELLPVLVDDVLLLLRRRVLHAVDLLAGHDVAITLQRHLLPPRYLAPRYFRERGLLIASTHSFASMCRRVTAQHPAARVRSSLTVSYRCLVR